MPNGSVWYVPRIIRQESVFRQFNNGTPGTGNGAPVKDSEDRDLDNGGRPNFGGPYGWGFMQLDNLGSSVYREWSAIGNR